MTTNESEENKGFWKKQFSSNATSYQVIFDVLLGVVAPLICIIFDPFVFRFNVVVYSPVGNYRVFAYLGIGLGTVTLLSWLIFGSRLENKWKGIFAGSLLVGALFAFVIGLVLFPFSVLGLLFGIGVFGFTPFLTGFVYLRNGIRALKYKDQIQAINEKNQFFASGIVCVLMIIAIPAFVQFHTSQIVSQGIQLILSGEAENAEEGVQSLQSAFWCDNGCYNEIVSAYLKGFDDTRQAILAKAYEELTGQTIDEIIQQMWD